MRRSYVEEKGFTVIEMWECEWKRLYKTSNNVKKHIRENFPFRRSFAAEHQIQELKKEKKLAPINATLKYAKTLEPNLPTSLHFPGTLY